MSQIKVLITGTNGQLGSELRAICLNNEHIIYRFIGRMEMDLEEIDQIQPILESYKPNYIVHTAAYTAVDAAENHPEIADKINHLASLEIAKYCMQNHCRLLYISTDYVFKGDQATPLEEDYPTNPINTYGETKLKGELAIINTCPEAIIIRTSWVYSGFGKNFVKT
ncbi:MAG: SDR family oxidoreductase, partial [Sphingobacterium sp.]